MVISSGVGRCRRRTTPDDMTIYEFLRKYKPAFNRRVHVPDVLSPMRLDFHEKNLKVFQGHMIAINKSFAMSFNCQILTEIRLN